jgi:voltage-gated potassium channel
LWFYISIALVRPLARLILRKPFWPAMKELVPKRYRKGIILLLILLMIIIIGSAGFSIIEGVSVAAGFHMTMATVFTVGYYGDLTVKTEAGKFFSDFIMVVGVGVGLYSLTQLIETALSGRLREMFRMTDYDDIVAKMSDHVIVCGYGRVGRAAVESLRRQDIEVVVLDPLKLPMKDLDPAVPRIVGDSTKEEDLARAGISRAKVVLVTFGKDADAILTVVTVKYLSPSLMTVVRAENRENIDKMFKVGADSVISPELEGGRSMSNVACISYGKGNIECVTAQAQPPAARKGK